jgi:ribonuclease BN (tRNA processing enzyme)
MLTATFLGVGGAFAKRNFQSNVLIEAWQTGPEQQDQPDDTLLIDFGTTGPLALHQLKDCAGFGYLRAGAIANYPALRRVLITHTHADHVGGLEELAFSTMFLSPAEEGKHFKPQLISAMSILVNLWDHSLKGGMEALRPGEAEHDRFQMLKRYEFSLFPTDHMRIRQKYDWPSFGVLMTDRKTGETAFFSGDTKFDYAAYATMLHDSKMNFHEVELHEYPDPVHSLLSELRTMPADVKSKTLLYHYNDDFDTAAYACVAEEFAGFVQPQTRYVVFA